MDGSSPKFKLLQQSQKLKEPCVRDGTTSLSNWFDINDETDGVCRPHESPGVALKRQSSCGSTNKGISPNHRRFSPCLNWTRSRDTSKIKFEHFVDSSFYIAQYRRAKQSKIDEKLARLIQHKEKPLHGQNGNNSGSQNDQSSAIESTEQSMCACPKQGQSGPQEPGTRQRGGTVKPSLPQSGYFAGRKWVYPKDFVRVYSRNIGVKCGSPRTPIKRSEKQVQTISSHMYLQGTGKPLNTSCNKNWTVLRHRTACKSAPAARQNPMAKKRRSQDRWHTTPTDHIKSSSETKPLTCADLTALLEKHSITQHAQHSVQPSFEHGKATKNTNSEHDSLEYKNIFRDVLDFYEHKTDPRSNVYVNIGS